MRYFVFDVESVGLHGPAFAVGFCVVDDNGVELAHGKFSVGPRKITTIAPELHEHVNAGFLWVQKNCIELPGTHNTRCEMREAFWTEWERWGLFETLCTDPDEKCLMAADVPWPVEATFLSDCIKDDPLRASTTAPYPLIDVASVLLANGENPLANYTRLENELPVHDPLVDARQSARLLVTALHKR